jgi:Na+-translocating ferredoxin:NAD+ oxidoreductase RnfG subunit
MSEEPQAAPASRKLPKAVIVLACICLASGLGVGALYHSMKDDIELNMGKAFGQALQVVLGVADNYDLVGDYDGEVADDEKVYTLGTGSQVLYAATGSAKGYQSVVKVIVSVEADSPETPVDADPVIHAMAVVSSGETPGLGENIRAVEKDVSLWGAVAGQKSTPRRPWFQEQFTGKRLSDLVVEKRKDSAKIAALTGATITSEATTKAVRSAVQRVIDRTAEVYGQ